MNDTQQVEHLSLAEALDPATLKLQLQSLGMQTADLLENKREIIQAYLSLSRSIEEMELLLSDAKNVVDYYSNLRSKTITEMERLELENKSGSRGAKALLHAHFQTVEELLQQSHMTLLIMTNSEPCSPTFLDSDSSDSDLSDFDYD